MPCRVCHAVVRRTIPHAVLCFIKYYNRIYRVQTSGTHDDGTCETSILRLFGVFNYFLIQIQNVVM